MATYGARGTDDLNTDRISRRMTRRAQPYRKRRRDRQLGPTLSAMLRGRRAPKPPVHIDRPSTSPGYASGVKVVTVGGPPAVLYESFMVPAEANFHPV